MALNPREVILEATRRLSASDGLHGLTMRKVAAEVGVTAPALYRHFGNKAELIEALIEEARAAFLGFLTDSLSGATPWERLQLAQRAFLRFALERPDAYELLLMTPTRWACSGCPRVWTSGAASRRPRSGCASIAWPSAFAAATCVRATRPSSR